MMSEKTPHVEKIMVGENSTLFGPMRRHGLENKTRIVILPRIVVVALQILVRAVVPSHEREGCADSVREACAAS